MDTNTIVFLSIGKAHQLGFETCMEFSCPWPCMAGNQQVLTKSANQQRSFTRFISPASSAINDPPHNLL